MDAVSEWTPSDYSFIGPLTLMGDHISGVGLCRGGGLEMYAQWLIDQDMSWRLIVE